MKKNEQASQYEGFVEGEQVGFTVVSAVRDAVEMPRTVVPEQFGSRGYAGVIVQAALDDIRAQGKKLVPSCPYVDAWITKHQEYADLRAWASRPTPAPRPVAGASPRLPCAARRPLRVASVPSGHPYVTHLVSLDVERLPDPPVRGEDGSIR